ncbi:MAG: ribosome biogenesis GTPase Der [Verrucomicrobiales bacterium]
MSGLIAIVGRPNVGKSALFNRIVGKRIAIVHDEPGVTRDRVTAEAEWKGKSFTLVDTGGIGLNRREKATDVIMQAALDQVNLAIEAAHVIILAVNLQEGVVPLDEEVAGRLRSSGKTVLVAANKADNYKLEAALTEFEKLGFKQIFAVSAIHGRGVEDLMDEALKSIPPELLEKKTVEEGGEPPLKLAIVGRPNVGKSSIINALTRSERVVVSPIAGTTRDAVDVPFEIETEGGKEKYVLIDTAGVRQERRIDNSIEFFSVKRTEESIGRADIVIFVLDAEAGILMQDKKIGGKIVDEAKACIVVVNKWDLAEESVKEARLKEIERRDKKKHLETEQKPMTTLAEFAEWVQHNMFFLDYAPVIFTSAKSGFHLDRLLEAVRFVASQLKQKIPTSLLNRTINQAIEQRQPVSAMGHRLKFFYATQVRQAPPTFLLFVNRDELFSPPYSKYLAGEIRKSFGYEGCPILLVPKARPKTIEPKRKFKTIPGAGKGGPGQKRERNRDKRNKSVRRGR